MKLIFVGSVYPKDLFEYLLNKGEHASFAADIFQRALISGLSLYYEGIEIVSSPKVGKLNMYDKSILRPKEIVGFYSSNVNLHYVGSSQKNRFLGMLLEFIRVRNTIRGLLNKDIQQNIACCYALHSPFLLALVMLRRRLKKVCVVVPDLPEYMSDYDNIILKCAKKIDRWVINFCIKKLDCFVLFSRAMKERLPISCKPWVVIEGIYQPKFIPNVEKSIKTSILYTGQLQKRYGIYDLVKAFMLIPNQDFELWLCGKGSKEESLWLDSQVKKDSRIKLLGMVKPEEAFTLQKKAHLLVNPRHSNEEFTKYSFPSKTMEYLASGTPTLMCRLPSIPDEYYKYLFFFEDESVVGMKNKMIEVCTLDKDYLAKKGEEAASFIRDKKNNSYQASKIVNLLQ